MLSRPLRRQPNIETASGQRLMFDETAQSITSTPLRINGITEAQLFLIVFRLAVGLHLISNPANLYP